MKSYQQAADDVGVIAETIETLGKLIDRFHAQHGNVLYQSLEAAWPGAVDICSATAKPLYALERKLTPPEDAP